MPSKAPSPRPLYLVPLISANFFLSRRGEVFSLCEAKLSAAVNPKGGRRSIITSKR
jgi:hypothetical protein